MRILSKFKDFYDSASSYGVDLEWVYNRETRREVILEHTPHYLLDAAYGISYNDPKELRERNFKEYYRGIDGKIKTQRLLIGCGGEIIPVIQLLYYETEFKDEHWNIRMEFIYSFEDFQEKFQDPKLKEIKSLWNRHSRNTDSSVKAFFEDKKQYEQVMKKYFHQLNAPLFVYEGMEFDSARRDHYNLHFVVNPNLKELSLHKKNHPAEVFQKIFMFLSGVLGNVEKDTLDISDKHKVKQRGFDEKYGFRTRPKNKKK